MIVDPNKLTHNLPPVKPPDVWEAPAATAANATKACLALDTGGVDDKSFNASAWAGAQAAAKAVAAASTSWGEILKAINEIPTSVETKLIVDKIENIKDINNYLPQELRVTKDEYSQAVQDDIFRVKTLTKLQSALTLLSTQINPDTLTGLNIFSGFISVLDKNLVMIQEHNIDMKNNLQEIENKKSKVVEKTFWQELLKVLKNIFK